MIKRSLLTRVCAAAAAILVLSSCVAGMGRVISYPGGLADAKVRVGHREYSIWFHDADPTILIMRGFAGAAAQGAVEGFTWRAVRPRQPASTWRAAGDVVLEDVGCRIVAIYTLDDEKTWEAQYECDGVVPLPRERILEHRDRWRQGLQTDDPTGPG
jgi:hypothetical protein